MDNLINIIDYIDEQHQSKLDSIIVCLDNDNVFIKYKTKKGTIISSVTTVGYLINEMPTLVKAKIDSYIIEQYIIKHINDELKFVLSETKQN